MYRKQSKMSYYRSDRSRPFAPQDTPGTNFIIASNVVMFVLDFLRLLPGSVYQLLVSGTLDVWRAPWTFLTYPLISRSGDAFKFLSFLFSVVWLYFVGSMLERSWGTKRFLLCFFGLSGVSAFFISLAGLFLGVQVGFGELLFPLVDLTVIWAMLEPEAPVLFFGFPMKLRWIAVITSLMLLFQFGQVHPLLGFFSLGGCGVAALYTQRTNRIKKHSRSRTSQAAKRRFSLNPFEWYRRWQFKRKFRRLWGD